MEPPSGGGADALRDEKVKVLRAARSITPDDVVYGQFDGYLDEHGVAQDSQVETFAALRLEIDSWRWSGVPWFIRTGKLMATTALEAVIELRAHARPCSSRARPRRARTPTSSGSVWGVTAGCRCHRGQAPRAHLRHQADLARRRLRHQPRRVRRRLRAPAGRHPRRQPAPLRPAGHRGGGLARRGAALGASIPVYPYAAGSMGPERGVSAAVDRAALVRPGRPTLDPRRLRGDRRDRGDRGDRRQRGRRQELTLTRRQGARSSS